jgi:putative Holliday junction resolvase
MTKITIEELADHLSPGQTIAAIDLGTKTIGIAVSDIGHSFANPRDVIVRRKFSQDAAALQKILASENAGVLVIGLPVNMDGTEGPRAQATRAFARNFAARSDVPQLFWDERLSTVAAERALVDMDVSRAKRAKRIDSAAAAFILQGVLDRLRSAR